MIIYFEETITLPVTMALCTFYNYLFPFNEKDLFFNDGKDNGECHNPTIRKGTACKKKNCEGPSRCPYYHTSESIQELYENGAFPHGMLMEKDILDLVYDYLSGKPRQDFLEGSLRKRIETLPYLHAKLKELKKLSTQIQTEKEAVGDFEFVMASLKQQQEELTSDIETATKKLNDSEEAVKARSDETCMLQRGLDQQLQLHQQALSKLEHEYAMQHETIQEKIAILTKKLSTTTPAVQDLELQVLRNENRSNSLQKELAGFLENITCLEKDVNATRIKQSSFTKQQKELESSIAELNESIEKGKEEEKRVTALFSSFLEQQQDLTLLHSQFANADREKKYYESQVEGTLRELETQKKLFHDLNHQLVDEKTKTDLVFKTILRQRELQSNIGNKNMVLPSDEKNNCIVCMSEPKKVAFTPCGHYGFCQDCADQCPTCPICKVRKTGTQNVFLS